MLAQAASSKDQSTPKPRMARLKLDKTISLSTALTVPRAKAKVLATDIPEGMPLVSVRELEHLIRTYDGTVELALGPNAIQYLLKLNTGNRPLSEKRSKLWAGVMETGSWYRTGEPLIMSETGIINTGQHRLLAASIYGKPIRFFITFGVSREAFPMTDTGRPHGGSDVLYILGVKHYALVSATLRLLVLYKEGLPSSANRAVSNDAIVKANKKYSDVSATTQLMLEYMSGRRGFNSSTMNAVTWLSVHAYGEERTRQFLEIVRDGLAKDKNDAARQLREFLSNNDPTRVRIAQIGRFAMCLKALIFWMDGVPITPRQIRWKDSDTFPKIEGLKM